MTTTGGDSLVAAVRVNLVPERFIYSFPVRTSRELDTHILTRMSVALSVPVSPYAEGTLTYSKDEEEDECRF